MIPSLLAVCFFSICSVFGSRSVRYFGEHKANLIRITIAVFLLGFWAFSFGKGLTDRSNVWFFISGIIGFGIGDTGLFLALPRIGIQLSALMTLCLSAAIGAVVEYAWMGTPLTGGQICSGAVILLGVGLVLLGRPKMQAGDGSYWGFFWGGVSALGQGIGAVISRKGYMVAEAPGAVDFGTAAFERVLGGFVFILLVYLVLGSGSKTVVFADKEASFCKRYGSVSGVALFGPILGVSCFQWALSIAPGGVVLPVVSMTPIAVIPIAYLMEGEVPTIRSLQGGMVAVIGTMMMAYFSAI